MKPHIQVEITAGTLANMTPEQFKSLQDNVLKEGVWDSVDSVRISGGTYLGIEIGGMFLGIEKDGYCHS